jgi:hypothetical protein
MGNGERGGERKEGNSACFNKVCAILRANFLTIDFPIEVCWEKS